MVVVVAAGSCGGGGGGCGCGWDADGVVDRNGAWESFGCGCHVWVMRLVT